LKKIEIGKRGENQSQFPLYESKKARQKIITGGNTSRLAFAYTYFLSPYCLDFVVPCHFGIGVNPNHFLIVALPPLKYAQV